MFTGTLDIDQRLKEMNDTFLARLAGLSGIVSLPRTSGRGVDDRDRSVSRERVLTAMGAFLPESYDLLLRRRRSRISPLSNTY